MVTIKNSPPDAKTRARMRLDLDRLFYLMARDWRVQARFRGAQPSCSPLWTPVLPGGAWEVLTTEDPEATGIHRGHPQPKRNAAYPSFSKNKQIVSIPR